MGDILFLAHRVPFPPNRGDKIRAHHLLQRLARIAPVHVGCFSESDEDQRAEPELAALATSYRIVPRTKPLVLAGVEALATNEPVSLTAFRSNALAQWVRDTIASKSISTIVVFSGQMGQYIPAEFDGRVVIDLCDVDSAKFEGYAASGQRVWLNRREGRLLAKEEERLAQRADATVLISDNEAGLFKSRLRFPSKANVQVIGNGIDASFFNPAVTQPHHEIASRPGPHFVFTGQMDYPPNETAALWTIAQLLPHIRRVFPEAEFHVVGRNPTDKLLAYSGRAGVQVWGEVPDVRPFIAAATFAIAPLMIARGVQNKVLEAMAMARPVLVTPQAATGIDAVDGTDWLKCEADPDAMVSLLTPVINEPETADRMGAAARRFVLERHAWDAMLAPLEDLVATHRNEVQHAA